MKKRLLYYRMAWHLQLCKVYCNYLLKTEKGTREHTIALKKWDYHAPIAIRLMGDYMDILLEKG